MDCNYFSVISDNGQKSGTLPAKFSKEFQTGWRFIYLFSKRSKLFGKNYFSFARIRKTRKLGFYENVSKKWGKNPHYLKLILINIDNINIPLLGFSQLLG
jgi:hypothetical protein